MRGLMDASPICLFHRVPAGSGEFWRRDARLAHGAFSGDHRLLQLCFLLMYASWAGGNGVGLSSRFPALTVPVSVARVLTAVALAGVDPYLDPRVQPARCDRVGAGRLFPGQTSARAAAWDPIGVSRSTSLRESCARLAESYISAGSWTYGRGAGASVPPLCIHRRVVATRFTMTSTCPLLLLRRAPLSPIVRNARRPTCSVVVDDESLWAPRARSE